VTTGYISFDLPVKAYKYLDSLVRLAKLIKHDKKMLPLRSDIASVVYFDIGVWHKDDSKQDVLNQAKETLELLDAIDDVMECRGCEPQWRWQIYVHVGTAYYHLGMIEEAKKYINQAIKIVDSITNQDNRLYTLGIVVVNLYSASPDKETISTIIQEIKVLADSQQTPTAKIAQDHIPQYIQHFGLEQ
jgi:tetratricopeptide (TPR) repeat protein